MELYASDIIAIVGAIAVVGALGFLVYFKLEDKREEKRQRQL